MLWPFEYFSPKSKQEVTKYLLDLPNTKLLAGGTDLLVNMRNGFIRPDHLIDIKKVSDLDRYEINSEKKSYIGANVILNKLIDDKEVKWACVKESAISIATHQVRNRATVLGNICNASPAADIATPLLVLGADIVIHLTDNSEKNVPLDQFFTGVKKTVLQNGEYAVGIEIPPLSKSAKTYFMKKQRIKGHDLAIVNISGLYDADSGKLRIAVGACAITPLLFVFDELIQQKKTKDKITEEVLNTVLSKISPISDNRSSAEYRMDMVNLFVNKMISHIFN